MKTQKTLQYVLATDLPRYAAAPINNPPKNLPFSLASFSKSEVNTSCFPEFLRSITESQIWGFSTL